LGNKPLPTYDFGGLCFQAGGGFVFAPPAELEGAAGLPADFAFFGLRDSRLVCCSRLAIGSSLHFRANPGPAGSAGDRPMMRARDHRARSEVADIIDKNEQIWMAKLFHRCDASRPVQLIAKTREERLGRIAVRGRLRRDSVSLVGIEHQAR